MWALQGRTYPNGIQIAAIHDHTHPVYVGDALAIKWTVTVYLKDDRAKHCDLLVAPGKEQAAADWLDAAIGEYPITV